MSYYYVFMLFMIITNLLPHNIYAQDCDPSGTLVGTQAPSDKCDPSGAECCEAGKDYQTYTCSPQVTSQTGAILTLNSFESGGDGGAASNCDDSFHSDDTPVVALSTGWYSDGSRCGKQIVISGNGVSVAATVVDECDSKMGCDEDHGYQPPCRDNIVDGSKAVWDALGVSSDNFQFSSEGERAMNYKLGVEVTAAHDLIAKDSDGSSSAYVELNFDDQRFKTSIRDKDLNPVWNESFYFNISDPNNLSNLTLDAYVYNYVRSTNSKNFLGKVHINGSSFVPYSESSEFYYPLEKRGVYSRVTGELGLKVFITDNPSV